MDCASFHDRFSRAFCFDCMYLLSIQVIPKWKDIIKTKGHDKIMIDLNDIKYVLKGSDAINNIVNIFFHHILRDV